MKKILPFLYVLSVVVVASTNIISCGTPQGNKIKVYYQSKDNDEELINDPNVYANFLMPIMNFMNETDSNKKNDDDKLTKDQRDNRIEVNIKKWVSENSIWNNFYNDWSTSKDTYYTNIKVKTEEDVKDVPTFDFEKGKENDSKIWVNSNIANVINKLNGEAEENNDKIEKQYQKGYYYAIIRLDKDNKDEEDKKNSDVTINVEYDNKFSFNVICKNLYGAASIIKTKDNKYKWYYTGFIFPKEFDQIEWSSELVDDYKIVTPFSFDFPNPDKKISPNLKYYIDPRSITAIIQPQTN